MQKFYISAEGGPFAVAGVCLCYSKEGLAVHASPIVTVVYGRPNGLGVSLRLNADSADFITKIEPKRRS